MLEGVRIIEMANVISGPFAGMLLADMGADVVKVEIPGRGDPFRGWAGSDDVIAPSFAAYNRGKRSVALETRSKAGKDAYLRLVGQADVVIDNFRPGTLDESGIGPKRLCAEFPGLIYCSISGLGSTGPDRDLPTYDAIAQARSGLWSQLTDIAAPEAVGPPISDQLTGLYAAQAILGALVARGRKGGQGQHVEVSMLAASLAFQPHAVAEYLANGAVPDRTSRAQVSQSYAFVAADGGALAIHLSSLPKFWTALLAVLDRHDLDHDPRFNPRKLRHANYDALRAELQRTIATRPRAEWLQLLRDADVPCAAIHRLDEALADPHVRSQNLVSVFGRGSRATELMGRGFITTGTVPDPADCPVPLLGEHSAEVLRDCGLTDSEIEAVTTATP
ncbi:MAG: CaiB/BaiF CoA-transferase family protein [Tabrizicola sp.]|nr:CaiB/BaiF CoA-transferase family protein [Tabrizicola sp.]